MVPSFSGHVKLSNAAGQRLVPAGVEFGSESWKLLGVIYGRGAREQSFAFFARCELW
jgi:hypothetical protein